MGNEVKIAKAKEDETLPPVLLGQAETRTCKATIDPSSLVLVQQYVSCIYSTAVCHFDEINENNTKF